MGKAVHLGVDLFEGDLDFLVADIALSSCEKESSKQKTILGYAPMLCKLCIAS